MDGKIQGPNAVKVKKSARQTEHLDQMQQNAKADWETIGSSGDLAPEDDTYREPGDDLNIGSDPEANLTGPVQEKDQNDSWKNSLADDELRAPDS
ncbi:hypothetical protein [Pedobacter ginsengisoli]|uniref:hypothetical protein n=1 Tax=Pedobacter ginsengisoli TaxID=363852 RepID=UPI00254C08E0|nr:hypothetical protein [Pedobacter ginsengisoli]